MATQLEPLNIRITGSSEGLSTALAGLQNQVRGFAAGIQSISSGFKALLGAAGPVGLAIGAGFTAALPVVHAFESGVSAIADSMRRVDEIADAANKLGVSFTELRALRLAVGEATGMEGDAVDAAIAKFQLNLSEAAISKTGKVFDTLEKLGLDAAKLLEMGPEQALVAISERISQMKSPTDQLSVAFELFGKQGVQLVNALRESPTALQDSLRWAKENLGLTEQQVEAVGKANDAWDRISAQAETFGMVVAAELAPHVEAITTFLSEWIRQLGGAQAAAKGLIATLGTAGSVAFDMSGLGAVNKLLGGDSATSTFMALERETARAQKLDAELKKIQAKGPTESELAALEAQKRSQKEAEDAAARIAKEWERVGESLAKSLETPIEEYLRVTDQLKGAFETGNLSAELFTRGMDRAAEHFIDIQTKAQGGPSGGILAANSDRASQMMALAQMKLAEQQMTAEAIRRAEAQKQLEVAQESRDLLKKLAGDAPAAAPSIANFD